jgi:hypothetical protein
VDRFDFDASTLSVPLDRAKKIRGSIGFLGSEPDSRGEGAPRSLSSRRVHVNNGLSTVNEKKLH